MLSRVVLCRVGSRAACRRTDFRAIVRVVLNRGGRQDGIQTE